MAENLTELTPNEPDILLCLSNMNFPPGVIATAGLEKYGTLLDAIEGTDETESERPNALFPGGYDLTLTRRTAYATPNGAVVSSIHQPWPEGPIRGTKYALSLPDAKSKAIGLLVNTAAYGMMPETHRSIPTMKRVSERLGGVPATVYAHHKDRRGRLIDFAGTGLDCSTQLGPEWALAITGSTKKPHEVAESLLARGVEGYKSASHHMRRGADLNPEKRIDWKATMQAFEEVGVRLDGDHVEVGRQDSKHQEDRERSQRELAAVLEGPEAIERTELGEILAENHAVWKRQMEEGITPLTDKRLVTLEIAYNGLRVHRQGEQVDRATFNSMHRDAAQSIREYYARLSRANPLPIAA